MSTITPDLVVAGQLRREFILPPDDRPPLVDVPGGNALYAAAGARLWESSAGLLARVGEDYPQHWLKDFAKRGIDPGGVKVLPEAMDLRLFMAYMPNEKTPQLTNPVSHFVRIGRPFPKILLGYQPRQEKYDSRVQALPDSPRLNDIPAHYLNARAVHICPMDFLTHTQLVTAFRQSSAMAITLDPSPAYMTPNFLEEIRAMLQGVTAFLPTEEELRALFWGRTHDLWEMAASLTSAGCEMVIIKRGPLGQLIYDANTHRKWDAPAYPSRTVDTTGAGHAFAGGFLSGYLQTFDPMRAALHGSVSASIAVEGSGAFFALDAMPGLAASRLNSIADLVRSL